MGRMDGNAINGTCEARTIEGWRQECEWLRDRVAQLETQLKAEQASSIVGRGYRSVTVYADGTVEVDRAFDDDDSQPASRRTL